MLTAPGDKATSFKQGLEHGRLLGRHWDLIDRTVAIALTPDRGAVEFTIDPEARSDPLLVYALKIGEVTALMELFVTAKMMAQGPKVFRPSMEQCLALAQMEPRFGCGDHKQPYPTMVVEFPERFSQLKGGRCTDDLGHEGFFRPLFCIVHHAPEVPAIVCSTSWSSGQSIVRTLHHHGAEQKTTTIAEVFARAATVPPGSDDINEMEEDSSVSCLRVAINALSLLFHYGHRTDPENPSYVERLKRHRKVQEKRGDLKKLEQTKRDLALAVQVCDFEQKIVLFDTHGPQRVSYNGTDLGEIRSVRPHWRRGHMRMQPHGPHSSLRKLVVIKPILIHANAYQGGGSVFYETKEKT